MAVVIIISWTHTHTHTHSITIMLHIAYVNVRDFIYTFRLKYLFVPIWSHLWVDFSIFFFFVRFLAITCILFSLSLYLSIFRFLFLFYSNSLIDDEKKKERKRARMSMNTTPKRQQFIYRKKMAILYVSNLYVKLTRSPNWCATPKLNIYMYTHSASSVSTIG